MLEKKSDKGKSQILIFLVSNTGYFENFEKALIEMGHHDYVF